MDVKQIVEETLLETDRDVERALQGLTVQELDWRPGGESNSIGFNLWHMTAAEDDWISTFPRTVSKVSVRDGWAKRWAIPERDNGYGYDLEKLSTFVTPPLAELWEYNRSVRKETLDYMNSLTNQHFDLEPATDMPYRKGFTIGRMFSHLLCEINQHVGHICYVRGLQRGLNK